ncbi:ABC transporter permease [Thermotoga sp. KOL6]|nr:ABC transporter permease [Thermotoga sp. KOL6]
MKRKGIGPFLFFIIPTLLIVAFILLYPVVYVFFISFTNRQLLFLGNVKFIGFQNYSSMFKDPDFWHSLWLQLGFIAIALPIELIIGFFVALLFNKEFPFSKLLRSLLMLPVFVLPVLSGLTWRLMLQPDYGVLAALFQRLSIGPEAWLADKTFSYVAVIFQDIWRMWPFMFMIIFAGLSSLPNEYIEAALIDGAGFFQRVSYIIIPFLKPVLAIAFLLRLIDALRIFSEVYVMTYGGPSNATMLLSLYIHKQAFEFGNISYASAVGTFLMIISLAISYFVVKRGLRGETL